MFGRSVVGVPLCHGTYTVSVTKREGWTVHMCANTRCARLHALPAAKSTLFGLGHASLLVHNGSHGHKFGPPKKPLQENKKSNTQLFWVAQWQAQPCLVNSGWQVNPRSKQSLPRSQEQGCLGARAQRMTTLQSCCRRTQGSVTRKQSSCQNLAGQITSQVDAHARVS